MTFDTLIVNGNVVDGTNRPRYRADVGINTGRITAVGPLSDAEASQRVDAAGRVVAPGFIDIHTHSDVTLLDDPGGESKAYQGVTTEVVGNCGFSPFPSGQAGPKAFQEALGSVLVSKTEWTWTDLDGWAKQLESNGVSLNVAPLVGHSALRVAAGATDDRPPTGDELQTMQRLAAEAVEQGAFGLSTGLTLAPSSYGAANEVVSLAQSIAEYDGTFYATHARVWAGWHIKAIEESVDVGRQTGLPVQYAHLAIIDSRVFGHGDELVGVIERARAEGVDISYDVYPYTAAGSNLNQMLPAWVQEGGVPEMLRRLRDPVRRARVRDELAQGWFRGLPWRWDTLVIAYVRSEQNQRFVGCSIAEIAELRGEDPTETFLALIDEEDNHVNLVAHNRIESDMRFFLQHPQAIIGSDGRAISPTGPYADAKPHPRFYGAFPRVLGRYVRDEHLLDLESAIFKMTGFPAQKVGLHDRGRVAEGQAADLVIFDPQSVIDRATFDDPHQFPEGISHVFVNGQAIVYEGQHTGARSGRVLRRGI